MEKTTSRLTFIDNVRILLISLVVLHHLAITYGAPGGWYYNEGQAGPLATLLMTLFVAANQSFFMGLLFFISAFFTSASLDKSDVKSFLAKRVLRLGMPLVLFFFVLSPLTIYWRYFFDPASTMSFVEFLQAHQGFGFGPLWFVEVLLLFALVFAGFFLIVRPEKKIMPKQPLPGAVKIVLFAITIGSLTFLVRLNMPVGWSLEPVNFQLAHFPQYISCLVLGVMAHKKQWLESLTLKSSVNWLIAAQVMIFIIFPLIFIIGGAASGDVEPFMGGLTFQSLAYSIWEQVNGFALMIGLLGVFKFKIKRQGRIAQSMSRSAYAVYIIHAPLVVFLTRGLRTIELSLFTKFIILAVPVVACCFLAAIVLRSIPLVKKII